MSKLKNIYDLKLANKIPELGSNTVNLLHPINVDLFKVFLLLVILNWMKSNLIELKVRERIMISEISSLFYLLFNTVWQIVVEKLTVCLPA
jgi:hypothetical protein